MESLKTDLDAIKEALVPAIKLVGTRSADMAKFVLIDHGVSTADMSVTDLMAVGATAWIGSLASLGFFTYVPLEEENSLAAELFAESCNDPALATKAKKVGVISDSLLTIIHNFTPVYSMIESAITASGECLTFPPVTELTPCSEGAIRWAQELGSPLHYHTPTPSVPFENLKQMATKICLEAIKEKELIPEKEMALLLSIPAKSLGNRRRDNEVNRSVYIQKKTNARAWYHKAKALAALQNDTFFVTPKLGKK